MDAVKILDEFEAEDLEAKQAAFDYVERLLHQPGYGAKELLRSLREEGRI